MQKKLEEMTPLVDSYNKSGMSVRKFCIEHQIKESTFVYWVRKLGKNKSGPTSFIPLQINQEGSTGYLMEVEQRDGTRYRFKELVSADYLREILARQ